MAPLRLLASVLLLAVGGVLFAPTPAVASSGLEWQLLDMVNAERAAVGVAPLEWRDDVAGIARAWSGVMAATGVLAHNDEYFSDGTRAQIGSKSRGENVADAMALATVHRSFMNSPAHYANIVNPAFTHAGFGIVQDAEGVLWVTEDFMQASGYSAPPPAPEPEPEPEAAVEPEVAVEVAPEPAPTTVAPTTTVPPTTVAPPTTTVAPTTVPVATVAPSTTVATVALEEVAVRADIDAPPANQHPDVAAAASAAGVLIALLLVIHAKVFHRRGIPAPR